MAKTPKTKTKTEMPCQCRAIFAYNITLGDTPETLREGDDPAEIVSIVHQSCGELTARTFAPGHDAKLKGVLLRAARSGMDYSYVEGGLLVHADPRTELEVRGWSHLLVDLKPRAKRERKPKAEKAADEATPAPAGFHPVRVKVGRWVYDGQILQTLAGGDVEVEWTTAKGEKVTKVVAPSQIVG